MINIPMNWNEIESKEIGDFKKLPSGAYIVRIVQTVEHLNTVTGNMSLKVDVDICEGEYKDFFKKQYDNNQNTDKKWASSGTKYVSLKEDQMQYFKGFITALNNSNTTQIKVEAGKPFNPAELTNLRVGAVFGLEEFMNDKGEVKANVKLRKFRSVNKLSEESQPDVKLIDGSYISEDDYNERNENNNNVTEVTDDMIPFTL